jgi:hypothetical protein
MTASNLVINTLQMPTQQLWDMHCYGLCQPYKCKLSPDLLTRFNPTGNLINTAYP